MDEKDKLIQDLRKENEKLKDLMDVHEEKKEMTMAEVIDKLEECTEWINRHEEDIKSMDYNMMVEVGDEEKIHFMAVSGDGPALLSITGMIIGDIMHGLGLDDEDEEIVDERSLS